MLDKDFDDDDELNETKTSGVKETTTRSIAGTMALVLLQNIEV